eukprot:COSAG04_NODE_4980_length_1794_cov_1.762242_1_plen_317_part_10
MPDYLTPAAPGGGGPQMDASCAICRDEVATMPAERELTTLGCGHLFCTPCIEHWFGQESTCPSCRRSLPSLRRCAQSTAGAWLSEREQPTLRAPAAPAPERGRPQADRGALQSPARKQPRPPCAADAAAAAAEGTLAEGARRLLRELAEGEDEPSEPPRKRPRVAEAALAQRRQPSSRYVGVGWAKQNYRWTAYIQHEGRQQHLGVFAEEEAAARAYDAGARRLRGDEAHGGRAASGHAWRLNFPTQAEAAAVSDDSSAEEVLCAAEAAAAQRQVAGQPTSRYVGVSWNKWKRRWESQIKHEGRQQNLGLFAEQEAA